MKVLFLIQGFTVAASRYRVIQYLPYFSDAGIDTEVIQFPDTGRGWRFVMDRVDSADVVFVQRKRLPLSVLRRLRKMKKKIVYDFDDAVMYKNSLSKNPYSLRRKMSFKRMLRHTDLVIAGNRFLKEEAAHYHNDIMILPTPVDADRYTAKSYSQKDVVTIGWIGDHGSIHYLEGFKDVWEELGKKYANVELTIICDTFIDTRHIRVNRVTWSLDTEMDDLKSIDIGIMPLYIDHWSKGKCGFKIIQYLGVGVPAVCTPVGINRDVVEDGKNGLWAESPEDWIRQLSRLIVNEELRAAMGRAGRETIMKGYTVQVCAPRLIEGIRGLF